MNGQIPSDLDQLIMKLLSKNPRSRYQSATELYDELHELAEKRSGWLTRTKTPPVQDQLSSHLSLGASSRCRQSWLQFWRQDFPATSSQSGQSCHWITLLQMRSSGQFRRGQVTLKAYALREGGARTPPNTSHSCKRGCSHAVNRGLSSEARKQRPDSRRPGPSLRAAIRCQAGAYQHRDQPEDELSRCRPLSVGAARGELPGRPGRGAPRQYGTASGLGNSGPLRLRQVVAGPSPIRCAGCGAVALRDR